MTIAQSAAALSVAGRHDEAIAQGRRAFDLDSTQPSARLFLLRAYLNAGRHADARTLADRLFRIRRDVNVSGFLAHAFGVVGDSTRARMIIRELESLPANEWRLQTSLGRAYLGVGDTSRALADFERAASRAGGDLLAITVSLADVMYDPIRHSTRFAAIRQLGLDERVFTSPNGGRPR